MRPDLEEAARFLAALDPEAKTWTFQTFDDDADRKDNKRFARVLIGTLDQHAAELERLNNEGAGVFVTINETDGKGRTTDNIIRVRAVFLDLDGAPLEPVLANGRQPHIVNESSPGKWHVYKRVRNMPLDDFKPAQRRDQAVQWRQERARPAARHAAARFLPPQGRTVPYAHRLDQ